MMVSHTAVGGGGGSIRSVLSSLNMATPRAVGQA
jgi:hypothetical protein